jgi:hypothetical protein
MPMPPGKNAAAPHLRAAREIGASIHVQVYESGVKAVKRPDSGQVRTHTDMERRTGTEFYWIFRTQLVGLRTVVAGVFFARITRVPVAGRRPTLSIYRRGSGWLNS